MRASSGAPRGARPLAAFTLVAIAAALLLPAMPQSLGYRDFADTRARYGIANFVDAASNVGRVECGWSSSTHSPPMARRRGAQRIESLRFRPATARVSGAPRRAARGIAAALLCVGSGCARAGDAASHAAYVLNPFSGTDVTVKSVSLVGPYLLVELAGRKEQLRLLAPASPECARVLQSEAEVRYQRAGHFGRLEREDESCDAVGVASLEAWRNRQPRRSASVQGVPRATARFSLVAETPKHLLVRGRFPLASEIRIPSGADLVALLPADEACRTAVARGQVSLEFRAAGRDPFRLLVGREACVIEGFATPIDAVR